MSPCQVRRVGDRLEMGFIDSAAYISCLGRASAPFPPTVFPSGSVSGADRQAELGMTDKRALLAETRQGTE